jgi:hypothetical protein
MAAHSRATLPVFGGISGWKRTTCIQVGIRTIGEMVFQ